MCVFVSPKTPIFHWALLCIVANIYFMYYIPINVMVYNYYILFIKKKSIEAQHTLHRKGQGTGTPFAGPYALKWLSCFPHSNLTDNYILQCCISPFIAHNSLCYFACVDIHFFELEIKISNKISYILLRAYT